MCDVTLKFFILCTDKVILWVEFPDPSTLEITTEIFLFLTVKQIKQRSNCPYQQDSQGRDLVQRVLQKIKFTLQTCT